GFDASSTIEALSVLKSSGLVDAFNVADSPRAQGRMSALATSALIQSRMGMETILHLTLRHRNLVALHSELLGAHALGVRNVFVVMGDLPSTGDYPNATAISDIKASGMIGLIKALNRGLDLNGKPIEEATSFFVGCAFNPNTADLDRELKVLDRKLKAGADFILTQPVYTAEVVERAHQRLGGFPTPVILGILPLRSYRHAEFLDNEVPGMTIPREVKERMRQAGDKAEEFGIRLCQELLQKVQGQVAGAYIMPPFGRYDVVLRVLKGVGEL
ncbi:MAG: methylenetetrahydrofolate reductase, partial [Dehalococcoidia bacterium]